MFDPTAFENMKVVMEGCLYDLDLSGDILVTDRNDWMNIAKLARKYEITFQLKSPEKISCTFVMEAGLSNLAAELLPDGDQKRAGVYISIIFTMHHQNDDMLITGALKELQKIWGTERLIEQTRKIGKHAFVKTELLVSFNRLITEENIDDLTSMTDYMVDSLYALKEQFSH